MGKIERGYTLLTAQTRQWTKEQFARNDAVEYLMVFSNFSAQDEGRGRNHLFTFSPACPLEIQDTVIARYNAFEPGGAVGRYMLATEELLDAMYEEDTTEARPKYDKAKVELETLLSKKESEAER